MKFLKLADDFYFTGISENSRNYIEEFENNNSLPLLKYLVDSEIGIGKIKLKGFQKVSYVPRIGSFILSTNSTSENYADVRSAKIGASNFKNYSLFLYSEENLKRFKN